MLKFACCANSFKLCPLVVEKGAFYEKICSSAVVDIAMDLESFDHIHSNATVC